MTRSLPLTRYYSLVRYRCAKDFPKSFAREFAIVFVGFLLLMSGCSTSEPTAPRKLKEAAITPKAVPPPKICFRDITAESGVDSTFRNGREAERFSILESLGGGVGIFDLDVDGHPDLFFTGGGQFVERDVIGNASRLFRNRGMHRFDDVSAISGIESARTYTQGVTIGDFNGDGFGDVLVQGYSGLQLFRNLGDGTFEEVHTEAGLMDALWSSGAAWGDFDKDGNPDLYVTHYVNWSFDNDPPCPSPWPEHDRDVCPPRAFEPLPDTLYYSDKAGRFNDVSSTAGLRLDGKGLGVITADLDHDGDLDIYVANDMVDNFLYRNDGAGNFTEVGLITGTASDLQGIPNGSMGLAVCDYNQDLIPDLWVTNFEQETFALYKNDESGFFVHSSREAGISDLGNLFVGFGTAMGDVDCDGDEDCLIANGHVVYYPTVSSLRQEPVLMENLGEGRFQRIGVEGTDFFATPRMGRGLASCDLNSDGRLDFVFAPCNEPASLLVNGTPREGTSYLTVKLVGTASTRDAIGARLVLKTSTGSYLRHLVGGGSFQSQNQQMIHFGWPAESDPESLRIHWPSGLSETFNELKRNTSCLIVEASKNIFTLDSTPQ